MIKSDQFSKLVCEGFDAVDPSRRTTWMQQIAHSQLSLWRSCRNSLDLFGRYGPCQRQGTQTWSLPLSFSFFIRLGDCLSTYLYIYVLAVRTETPESSISRLVHQSENAKNPNKSISCMLGFIEFVGTTCFVDPYCKANLEVPQLDTVDGRHPANQLIGSFIPLFTRFFYCPAGAGFLPSTVWLTIPAEFVAFFYRYGFDVWMFATA